MTALTGILAAWAFVSVWGWLAIIGNGTTQG